MHIPVHRIVKTINKTLVDYGPALFTCVASIYAVQHEDKKNHKIAKEVAELVMHELKNQNQR